MRVHLKCGREITTYLIKKKKGDLKTVQTNSAFKSAIMQNLHFVKYCPLK